MTMRPGDTLFLLDASSPFHRDHHSSKGDDPAYNVNSRGEPIGALKRFASRLFWQRIKGIRDSHPTHFGAVFDAGRRNWRHDLYDGYKSGRGETDLDLVRQMPLFRDAAEAFGIPAVEMPGYEADDLLGTYSLMAVEQGASCMIVTGDKDMLQLVRPGLTCFSPPAGVEGHAGYRPAQFFAHDEVVEKFGVPPDRVVDVLALMGDSTDSIPGVKGIGKKGAPELVGAYGSLEDVLAAAASGVMPASKTRDRLVEQADMARLSYDLAKIDCMVPVDVPLDDFLLEPLDLDRVEAFAREHELEAMLRQVEKDREFQSRRAIAG